MLETQEVYRDLALSLAIGLLIGIERGWSARVEAPGRRVAGLRTFGLLGLLGGLLGTIGLHVHPIASFVVLAGAVAAVVAGYVNDMRVNGRVSATSTVAALLTLCLGLIATNGYPRLAMAAAAAATLLLSLRSRLHAWLARLDERDVLATARFAIIAAAILPLLPDRRFGPYEAWNPRELWLVVVLVTGFSFAGYVAARRFGPARGTLATAAIGGMYSSTAVTAALSRRLADPAEPREALASGVALASAMMLLRVLVLTALLASSAAPTLAMLVGPAALVAVAIGAWQVRQSIGTPAAAPPVLGRGNPFELLPALGFALIVAVLALATRWAAARFGDGGIAALIAITGTFDVDAAIVTLGGLPEGMLAPEVAGLVLAGPVLLNTLFKAGIALALAGPRRGWPAALPLLAAAGTMLATAAVVALR
jgi:uncharacterized membrane protein (DUF4010 family)